MDYKQLAESILASAGGRENITEAAHCMTRLRLKFTSEAMIDAAAIEKTEGVLGTNMSSTEFQIILGPGRVNGVYEEFTALLENHVVSQPADKQAVPIGDYKAVKEKLKEKNSTPFKLMTRRVANIFLPLIPGFIACGLITGCLNIALKLDPSLAGNSMAHLLSIMGNTIFFALNIFVGIYTAKEFSGSPIMGGLLATVISHPMLGDIQLMGMQLTPGRGGIIAVLLVAFLGAVLERKLRQIIPEMFTLFLTPLVVLLVGGFAAILVLQPLGGVIAELIGSTATEAVSRGGALTGFILGGIWLPLVMLGVHQTMTPIHAQLLSEYGVTILLPILAMAGAGQIGAALAVYVKTKSKLLKKTIISALPVGLMGVGEPLIYGVTLPLGKPFICACIGGAFGGAFQAAFMIGSTAIGISGLPLAAVTDNIPMYLAGLVVAYISGFLITYIVGFDDPTERIN
ncbi:MAG: PTS transporter subunit EIIC [Anaerovibrio sp.]|uniref:PTS transporter subunit EIIC n=1 Tax=Anaerovibrio sp. TaxID=1872532 RepID=UPI0025CBACF5|nr:PTS transporter subunit EIIC [Anaerovibrio sp.]MCR5176563.1 PTS transporter subunit EIIC [Anaerovibrio sp.]